MSGENRVGFVLMLLVATFFMGSSFPTGKFLISSEAIPPFFLGGWRFLSAGLIVLLFYAVVHRPRDIIPASRQSAIAGLGAVFLVGLFQTAGAMGFLNLSLERIDSSIASVLFFTNPLWVLLMAHYTKTEFVTGRRIVGLLIGTAGVALCLGVQGGADLAGALLALSGAVSWAVCTILTVRYIKFDRSPFVLAGWQMAIGGALLIGVSVILGETYQVSDISPLGIFNYLWLLLPASVGSFTLWFLALKKGGVSTASSFLFLTPLFASFLSIVFLNEEMTTGFWIGGILIFASIYIVNTKASFTLNGFRRQQKFSSQTKEETIS